MRTFAGGRSRRIYLVGLAALVVAVPGVVLPSGARAANSAVSGTGYSALAKSNTASSASTSSGGDIAADVDNGKALWLKIGGVIGLVMTGVGVFIAWGKLSMKHLAMVGVFALVSAFALAGGLWDSAGNTAETIHDGGGAAVGQVK